MRQRRSSIRSTQPASAAVGVAAVAHRAGFVAEHEHAEEHAAHRVAAVDPAHRALRPGQLGEILQSRRPGVTRQAKAG